ncbi:MAG: two-component system NtrC family sensor kinase, partial [bacterium]
FIDNGKGMSSEIQEQIFEPFFTTKRGKGGTGLGLHIIYNLVNQRFKGKIFCESKEKEGTTFQVSIPKKMSLPENNLESA